MKKIILPVLTALFFIVVSLSANAQSAFEASAAINKTEQPVYKIELNYAPEVVEAALKKNFKDLIDVRGDESKNIRAYKGVTLHQISSNKYDYYTSVERKSKKENNKSVVYLWIANGGTSFISAANNPEVAGAALNFLNGFMGTASSYNHTLLVKQQEESVDKAQKKVNSLQSDIKDYEKKIADLNKKLEEAKKDLDNKQKEAENENRKLEDLRRQQ